MDTTTQPRLSKQARRRQRLDNFRMQGKLDGYEHHYHPPRAKDGYAARLAYILGYRQASLPLP